MNKCDNCNRNLLLDEWHDVGSNTFCSTRREREYFKLPAGFCEFCLAETCDVTRFGWLLRDAAIAALPQRYSSEYLPFGLRFEYPFGKSQCSICGSTISRLWVEVLSFRIIPFEKYRVLYLTKNIQGLCTKDILIRKLNK